MTNLYKIPEIEWQIKDEVVSHAHTVTHEYHVIPFDEHDFVVLYWNKQTQKSCNIDTAPRFKTLEEAKNWVENTHYPTALKKAGFEPVAHCEVSKPPEDFPPEQKVAFEILENTTRWLENYQNGLLTEKEYQNIFDGMVYMLANMLTLRFDPNKELPTKGEYVLIQLLSDCRSTDQANLRKVYYAVDNNGEDYSHWFNDNNDEFYCEVDEVAFWWRLPKLEVDDHD